MSPALILAIAALKLSMDHVRTRLIEVPLNGEFPGPGETRTLEVKGIRPGMEFQEIVPSWNIQAAEGAEITVELSPDLKSNQGNTRWYSMGTWTLGSQQGARTSRDGQGDDQAVVHTDVLQLKQPVHSLSLRLTLKNIGNDSAANRPRLERFVLSFRNTQVADSADLGIRSGAWGRSIDVPERAQGDYPNGGVLCSPTSLSMVLWHWSRVLNRPELNQDVPEITPRVWDAAYDGAGNWSFNVAYAGSFPSMVSYVARFDSISHLEQWTEAGVPVIVSVCLNRLLGRHTEESSGHLVVLVGFDENGEPIINDPAFRSGVRRTYARANLERAWRNSGRTVYLVYHVETSVPDSAEGLWLPPGTRAK